MTGSPYPPENGAPPARPDTGGSRRELARHLDPALDPEDPGRAEVRR